MHGFLSEASLLVTDGSQTSLERAICTWETELASQHGGSSVFYSPSRDPCFYCLTCIDSILVLSPGNWLGSGNSGLNMLVLRPRAKMVARPGQATASPVL